MFAFFYICFPCLFFQSFDWLNMFEYIRTHQRLMQFLLLLIIFPSFALFGVESYTRSKAAAGAEVATVAGQAITQQELEVAVRNKADSLRQAYGPQFDPKMLNTPEARASILDEIVAQRAITAEIQKERIVIPDRVLVNDYMSNPALVGADGKLDKDKFEQLLARSGYTKAGYEYERRQTLAFQQLISAVQNTAIVPKSVAQRIALLSEQEREVQLMILKNADFASKVNITDEMVKAYYEKNAANFEVPEAVKAEYVTLNAEALAAQASVNDTEVSDFYKANAKQFTTEEQRSARHILVAVSDKAAPADKEKARVKAQGLLEQVRKSPDVFAKLAKENSDDPGSKEAGGDLGVVAKNAMVKPFEDAVFRLKKDEISDLVQTQYGYHIIQLTSLSAGSVKPLADVKDQIVADIKKQKAAKAYGEAVEAFTDAVYQQPDSLKGVADKWKLKIETAEGITRKGIPAAPPTLPLNNPKFLKVLFADDVIKKNHNTEAVDVGSGNVIAAHVTEYKAASRRPLDQVRQLIVTRLTEEESAKLAATEGKNKLAALQKSPSAEGFAAPVTISRTKPEGVPAMAVPQIMKADVRQLPALTGVEIPGMGYAVIRVNKVSDGTPDQARRSQEQQQLASIYAEQELSAYVEALKKKAKATVNKTALTTPQPAN